MTADDDQITGEEPAWLRNARREIELRKQAREIQPDEGSLAQELRMLARLRATYPELPPELQAQAEALLRRRWFTPEAWDGMVAWIETTGWFARRSAT